MLQDQKDNIMPRSRENERNVRRPSLEKLISIARQASLLGLLATTLVHGRDVEAQSGGIVDVPFGDTNKSAQIQDKSWYVPETQTTGRPPSGDPAFFDVVSDPLSEKEGSNFQRAEVAPEVNVDIIIPGITEPIKVPESLINGSVQVVFPPSTNFNVRQVPGEGNSLAQTLNGGGTVFLANQELIAAIQAANPEVWAILNFQVGLQGVVTVNPTGNSNYDIWNMVVIPNNPSDSDQLFYTVGFMPADFVNQYRPATMPVVPDGAPPASALLEHREPPVAPATDLATATAENNLQGTQVAPGTPEASDITPTPAPTAAAEIAQLPGATLAEQLAGTDAVIYRPVPVEFLAPTDAKTYCLNCSGLTRPEWIEVRNSSNEKWRDYLASGGPSIADYLRVSNNSLERMAPRFVFTEDLNDGSQSENRAGFISSTEVVNGKTILVVRFINTDERTHHLLVYDEADTSGIEYASNYISVPSAQEFLDSNPNRLGSNLIFTRSAAEVAAILNDNTGRQVLVRYHKVVANIGRHIRNGTQRLFNEYYEALWNSVNRGTPPPPTTRNTEPVLITPGTDADFDVLLRFGAGQLIFLPR